jgi:hypothetical protein
LTIQKIKHDLKVDWASHEAAKYACENWHYSKSLPVPPLIKIGAWESGKFIGIIIFSRGASSNLLKPYGLDQTEGCELTRVALSKHETPVSRIMSLAFKFLKKSNPKLKLIVSFADPNEGHHGGIYQATNWIYTGKTEKSFKYIDKSNREWHSRQVSEKGYNIQQGMVRKTAKPSECKKIIQEGKHRYLMPLDVETRQKVLKLSKPYPKRASSVESGTTSFQEVRGGESPTDALQSKEGQNG